jgi:hypothetical protein
MAATQLNTFRTIRHTTTTSNVGIYTAPVNVASVVLNLQAANVVSGVSSITAYHSRGGSDIEIVKNFAIPSKDTGILIDKKLVLETDDMYCLAKPMELELGHKSVVQMNTFFL